MICTSIQHKSLDEILNIIDSRNLEMAEIRLDRCDLSDEDIDILFGDTDIPLIATCRVAESSEAFCAHRLQLAIEAGAKYVDLEIDAPVTLAKKIRRLARDNGTIFIRSYHNTQNTPSYEELEKIVSECQQFGGEVVKICTLTNSQDDIAKLERLYGFDREGSLVAFGMGEIGRQSRFECLKSGAPFTYASLSEDDCTAPGQWTCDEVSEALYGGKESLDIADFDIPASKSYAQRAIIAAALAEGTSHLNRYTSCEDSEAAIRVAQELGAVVSKTGDTLEIKGIGGIPALEGLDEVNVGESGLLARLLIPLLSLSGRPCIVVKGEKTLLRRPLNDANDIMAAFGVVLTNESDTRSKDIFVPARVTGTLIPGRADITGKGGSQLISGLLMSLPLADKNSFVCVQEPKSIPYMFVTMDVLRKFGVVIGNEIEGDEELVQTKDWSDCSAINFKIKGNQRYQSADFDLEGDWSTAANFLVAGAVFGKTEINGLDTSSVQADLSILDILADAGASISLVEDGPVIVRKAPLNAFRTDLNQSPDIFPIVSVLAAFCPGRSRIGGVGRLAGKESDRASAILNMLKSMGVDAFIEDDDMVIDGHSLSSRLAGRQLLKGGRFSSFHDHRMVMALKVAELGADAPFDIDDVTCVAKSFPEFSLTDK